MNEVDALLAEISACRRPIEFSTVATRASNMLAPLQLAELYRSMDQPAYAGQKEALRKPSRYWSHFYRRTFLLGRRRREFQNTRLSSGVRFFEEAGFDRRQKSLLILVSGFAGRVFVPVALMLDCLPDRPVDVIYLQANARDQYRTGVIGLGSNLREVATAMQSRFQTGKYVRIDVLGTSGGGLAALQLANFIDADNGVSIGGSYPFDPLRLRSLAARGITAFHSLCCCTPQKARRLVCTFAENSADDALAAAIVSRCCPRAILHPVTGQSQHGFLSVLYRHRQLEKFLAILLSDSPRLPRLSQIGYWVNGFVPRR